MWLKLTIILLFIAVVASLFTGFYFLIKDQGNARKRLLYALGIRITLAILLISTIAYGVYSGKISSQAPWDRQIHPEQVAP